VVRAVYIFYYTAYADIIVTTTTTTTTITIIIIIIIIIIAASLSQHTWFQGKPTLCNRRCGEPILNS
jgi:hypothetical protein